MRALAAIVLANLPVRWWGPFDRFPLYQMAWLSGLLTMMLGMAIGLPAYLSFMEDASDGFNTAIGADPDVGIRSTGWGIAGLPIFLFATPVGLLSNYLVNSGLIRFASAYIVDDVRGDFILTGLDALVRRIWGRTDAYDRRRAREKLEGRETPDRLVTGAQVEKPELELVLLSSRRKKEWAPSSYLVSADGSAFRIGQPFDVTTATGLRTAYPLTKLRGGEAIRHSILYELPPLWRGPLNN